ncbi:MAG: hypothetical protein QG622_3478 [Actinomycetota bacterium]|nr:hypothetical protein [Actinomycetota bacterium]
METIPPAAHPALRVTSGEATPEEFAAVLVALEIRRRAAVRETAVGPTDAVSITEDTESSWAGPAWGHRRAPEMPPPSPSAWRTSFRPR